MYQEVLRSIAGIEVFPIISLVLFVTFFTLMLVRTSRLDRRRLSEMARQPLDPAGDPGGSHGDLQ